MHSIRCCGGRILALVSAAAAIDLAVHSPSFPATQFVIEVVNPNPNDVAVKPSLGLDAEGSPHIAYFDDATNNLRLARKIAGVWTAETVEEWVSPTGRLSLELDAFGEPHVSYKDYNTVALHYARRVHDSWVVQVVDPGPSNVGYFSSIALDDGGNPHVSYQDATAGMLKYAQKFYGIWTRQFVDVGSYPSLAWQPGAISHISYIDGTGALKYARREAGVWTREIVDSAVSWYSSMAVDAVGNPHVAYYDYQNRDLRYAFKTAGMWTRIAVDTSPEDAGAFPSLALDSAGYVHISYSNVTRAVPMYARRLDGAWEIEQVGNAPDNSGGSSSLVLDARGLPHIAYRSEMVDGLRYARGLRRAAPGGEGDAKAMLGVGSEMGLRVFPDPSGDSFHIHYRLPRASPARLTAFDVSGREVAVFMTDNRRTEGSIVWDAASSAGGTVAQGVYFLRLATENQITVRRVTLIK